LKTAIYLRKSRAEELTDTLEDTLKKHKETLIEFATNNNLYITDIFEEVVSGENLHSRIQMLHLLENVEQGEYDAVLCMDIDRLGRGAMSQQGIILETFKNSNTKIITPRKIYDLNNEMDEEYTEFQTFFARRELKTIKRRMQQGLHKTIKDGGYIANAPYGYQKCRIGKLPSLCIVEEEAKFVKIMFDMYVNQHCGCQSIADYINSMGASPHRGLSFNRSTIMRILKSEVYIGKIVWNQKQHKKINTINGAKSYIIYNNKEKWTITNGIHPAIIDEKLFFSAQNIIKQKSHPSCKNDTLTNNLAGLILCANCGNKMQYRKGKTDNSHSYLICPKKGCIKSTMFDLVEKALLDAIKQELCNIKIKESNNVANNSLELQDALQQVKKELAQVIVQKNKLHDLLELNVYTIDVFLDRR